MILASTSSALAPGQLTETETLSMPKSGMSWVFMRLSETPPRMIMITISRFAAVG